MAKKQTLDQKVSASNGYVKISFPERGFGELSGRTFVMQQRYNLKNHNTSYLYLDGKAVQMGSSTYKFIKENSTPSSYQP